MVVTLSQIWSFHNLILVISILAIAHKRLIKVRSDIVHNLVDDFYIISKEQYLAINRIKIKSFVRDILDSHLINVYKDKMRSNIKSLL